MILISNTPKETGLIARDLIKKNIKKIFKEHAMVIALEGELGAGKTTFAKAFARALGIKAHITSPTFVLIKNYKVHFEDYESLIHIDAYRLKNFKDLLPLGIKEIITNPRNIVLIEWADRVRSILPKNYIKIHIDHINETTRKINIL